MRFMLLVAFATALGTTACSGSNDVAGGSDESNVVAGKDTRDIAAAADKKAGTASMTLKMTLEGATLDAVKQALRDPSLEFWKGLKRPRAVKIGADSFAIQGAGSALFTDVTRDGETLQAFMPFASSGLKSHSGLSMTLSFAVEDKEDSFTLSVTNPKVIQTKLLGVDVIKENQLSYVLTASRVAGGVAIEITENVKVVKNEDSAGKLLGCVIATADQLQATFSKKQ
jgi:hypothetical protein